ncbi:hypothetical protein L218DRAFT_1035890 [Marasmius fiardii PR-910]|nr:hypothetical protein L218DRAFT_1035890 [Marasmius fiardii PR-910]
MPKVSVERPEVLVKKFFHPYERRSPHIKHEAKENNPDTNSRFLEALSSLPPYPDLDSARQISTSSPAGNHRPQSPTDDQEYNDKQELIAPQQKPNVHRPIRSLIFVTVNVSAIVIITHPLA